jgi:multidrug efflux pump
MSLTSITISRPVLSIVLSITIVLFGVIGFLFLGIREYPSVDTPIVTVTTTYAGANPDVVESQITEPLEEALSGIPGLRTIRSTSREQRSSITVEFTLDTDLETAANDVRDRVSQAVARIPQDAERPIVQKADADAVPIVFLNIKSPKRDLLQLSKLANDIFKENFRSIPGVSQVDIWGEKLYSMRIWMDPQRLAAYRLTPQDVRAALQRENVELPSGRIEGANTELTLRTLGRLQTVEDFTNLVITETDGKKVSLGDIGYAELGAENYRTLLRRDGVPMVGTVLIPQPGANYIKIVDEFYKRLESLKRNAPPDIELGIGFDTTKYIRNSITEVVETLAIAFVLVVIIIFLFLRDWRATLIPVLAIPVSLIGAFFIMYISGFSINILTMLGIVLAIGIVVDDAIVVLENIYAKIENGMNAKEAAVLGAKEVYLAVLATTVALAAVFLPVVFLEGVTGRLFREFGVVLAGSVVISAFVALTLTPMMCSRLLKRHEQHNWFYRTTEPFFVRMTDAYRRSLHGFMQHRWLGFVGMGVSIGLIVLFLALLPTELAPLEDRGGVRLSLTAAEGTSFQAMDELMITMGDSVRSYVPESDAIIAVTAGGGGSVNTGFIRLILPDADERERSQQDIAAMLSQVARRRNEARIAVIQEPTISTGGGRGRSLPLQYVVRAQTIEKLRAVLPKFLDEARKNPVFDAVDVDLKFTKPEAVIAIDRARAQSLGVSTLDIAGTLQAALSGQRFGYFLMDGKQYQIIGQVAKNDRDATVDVKALYVRNNRGELIQLENLITIQEQSTTPQLYRFNRSVAATISASMVRGATLGQGIEGMNAVAKNVLDETFTTALDGEARDLTESSSSLTLAFVLALVLIYLVLAAQFESFRDPFTILLTVPLALAGALLTLWYFGQTLNIFSEIGIIMLIGLVAKNGILIVEFANQRKAQGLQPREAALEAAVERLRPILMTSIAMVLGTLPIALALGAGAESRISMGIAIIGGLVFSTFLTLYIVPAMYTYITGKQHGGSAQRQEIASVVHEDVEEGIVS